MNSQQYVLSLKREKKQVDALLIEKQTQLHNDVYKTLNFSVRDLNKQNTLTAPSEWIQFIP